ncbi:hypothetical protein [Streptomyces scabiei]|uniref:hypothetical protein n=1 Tax=Streptomyces scabiei TaxID=1930 RepID=UPI0029BDD57B|nr:hypothetical protein [Streptomyces scabiei]MDX3033014.1 hypothetical protein [Streptomyces scabiei]
MTTAQQTYLGWDQLQHFDGCARPAWTVDFRTEHDAFRSRHGGCKHECPNEECWHGDRYERTTVRIVCLSCQAACTVDSETGLRRGSSKTVTNGFGQPPRRMAGLLLWPGEPFWNFGRLSTEEPWDFIVTRPGVTRVAEADVVGSIGQGRGKRGGVCWSAAAVRSDDGPYGLRPLRFAYAENSLRTVAAAAKWAAARLVEAGTAVGGGE